MHRGRTERGNHHQNATREHHHAPSSTSSGCRLTGTCDGPLGSIFTVLSNYGVLTEAEIAALNIDDRSVAACVRDDIAGRFEPPDSPPPRA
jgi:hypothetical protein